MHDLEDVALISPSRAQSSNHYSNSQTKRNSNTAQLAILFATASWLFTAFLLLNPPDNSGVWGNNRFQQEKRFLSQQVYSPAQDEIEYYVKRFDGDTLDVPIEFSSSRNS